VHDGRDSGVATVTTDFKYLAKRLPKNLATPDVADPENAGFEALVELIQEQERITKNSTAQKILQNELNLSDDKLPSIGAWQN
jgi:hypothetical protein